MHIRKVQNKSGSISYQCIVKVEGKSQSATFASKMDAREWGVKTEKEMLDLRYFPERVQKYYRLTDAIRKYRDEILPLRAKGTQKHHHLILNWWEKNLGDTGLSNIDAEIIDHYRHVLLKKPRHVHTVNSYYDVLKHVVTLATSPAWNMLQKNPFDHIRRWKVKEERCPMLTEDQITSLLDACKDSKSPHLYAFVRIALATGGRKTEILTAKWGQVNFRTKQFTFLNTKNRKDRTVPLDTGTVQFLQEYLEQQTGLNDQQYTARYARLTAADAREFAPQQYIFWNERFQAPLVHLRGPWEHAKRKSNVPEDLRLHDLRHVFASNMAMYGGADIAAIADLLGHFQVQQTRRYAHLTEKHVSGFVQKMAEKVFR